MCRTEMTSLLSLEERKLGFEKTDYYDPILRKTTLRQGTSGFTRHHFCLLRHVETVILMTCCGKNEK